MWSVGLTYLGEETPGPGQRGEQQCRGFREGKVRGWGGEGKSAGVGVRGTVGTDLERRVGGRGCPSAPLCPVTES